MLIQLPTTNQTPAPCGKLRGLGCATSCDKCSRGGMRGLGAFYDSFPAPFNNPLVLAAVAVAVLMLFGGGLKLFTGRKSGNAKRAKLRLIQAQAQADRAKLLAA